MDVCGDTRCHGTSLCSIREKPCLPMKIHVIVSPSLRSRVNSANDLTDSSAQRHGASPQHGVSWTHAAFLHENPVIVSEANDLTDCAVQRHGASPQHGVSWTHAAFLHENPVIVSGANDLAGCAVQCHRSLPQQGAPWNAMPCSEIPPSGQDDNEGSLGYAVPCLPMPCSEIPPSGQDDMDVRCVPTMNIHETPCHRERSERSHRLSSTTP
jgi:hypothetical protein